MSYQSFNNKHNNLRSVPRTHLVGEPCMIGVTTRTKLIYSEFINEKQKGILNQFLYEMYDSEYPRVAIHLGIFHSLLVILFLLKT